MKESLVSALVEAHFARDDNRFRSLAAQAQSHARAPEVRAAMWRAINGTVEISAKAQVYLRPVSTNGAALVLGEAQSNALDQVRRELACRERLACMGFRARSRLLFHGPPGNGKSTAAAHLAGSLGLSAYRVHLPALIQSFMGDTAKNLEHLFGALDSGAFLLFDEIDAVGSARSGGGAGAEKEMNAVVNALLTLLDGSYSGVMAATTNRRDLLDAALVRRFDVEIEFPAPALALADRLIIQLAQKYRVDPLADDLGSFAAIAKSMHATALRKAVELIEAEAQPGGAP